MTVNEKIKREIPSFTIGYGIPIEEKASLLTQGRNGYGSEGVMKWYP